MEFGCAKRAKARVQASSNGQDSLLCPLHAFFLAANAATQTAAREPNRALAVRLVSGDVSAADPEAIDTKVRKVKVMIQPRIYCYLHFPYCKSATIALYARNNSLKATLHLPQRTFLLAGRKKRITCLRKESRHAYRDGMVSLSRHCSLRTREQPQKKVRLARVQSSIS